MMNRKKYFTLALLFFFFLSPFGGIKKGVAQQLPMFSQYMLNDYFQNPAVAGSKPYFNAVSANRLQWVGITDAPRTYYLSMNGPLTKLNMGVGGWLVADVIGPTRRTGFSGSYAYHLKLMEKAPGSESPLKLSLALSAGILQFAIDGSKLTLTDQSDYILNSYRSTLVPDFGFGFYLYSDKYWFGASAPQIYPAKLKWFDYINTTGTIVTHFYSSGGYKFSIADDFVAEPSFLIKYVAPAPVQIDVGTRVLYKNKVWLGGTYRTNDAISMMVGATYKENLSIGYAYDITTTNLKNYSSGTHELVVALRFNRPAPPAPPAVQ